MGMCVCVRACVCKRNILSFKGRDGEELEDCLCSLMHMCLGLRTHVPPSYPVPPLPYPLLINAADHMQCNLR